MRLLLHFPNHQLLIASAQGDRARQPQPLSSRLRQPNKAQQAPAPPWAACVMMSYSNPSVLCFLCGGLQLMSLLFSFLLPAGLQACVWCYGPAWCAPLCQGAGPQELSSSLQRTIEPAAARLGGPCPARVKIQPSRG